MDWNGLSSSSILKMMIRKSFSKYCFDLFPVYMVSDLSFKKPTQLEETNQ